MQTAEDSSPAWIDPKIETYFKQYILTAFRQPALFDPSLAPLPWTHAVVGRKGVRKLQTIQTLCQKYGIVAVHVIDVEFGRCGFAIDTFMCLIKAVQEKHGNEERAGPSNVVIINHADRLAYDAADQKEAVYALDIGGVAAEAGVLLIAICDRPKGAEEVHSMSPWARTCHSKFFSQFEIVAYAPCPTVDFNMEYIGHRISLFAKHMELNRRPITVELDDDDKILLRDCVRYGTLDNIDDWLRRVFLEFILDPFKMQLDMAVLQEHMSMNTGTYHICAYDAMDVESRFHEACGRGPLVTEKKKHNPPKAAAPSIPLITEKGATAQGALETLHQNEEQEPSPKRKRTRSSKKK